MSDSSSSKCKMTRIDQAGEEKLLILKPKNLICCTKNNFYINLLTQKIAIPFGFLGSQSLKLTVSKYLFPCIKFFFCSKLSHHKTDSTFSLEYFNLSFFKKYTYYSNLYPISLIILIEKVSISLLFIPRSCRDLKIKNTSRKIRIPPPIHDS